MSDDEAFLLKETSILQHYLYEYANKSFSKSAHQRFPEGFECILVHCTSCS